MKSIYDTLRRPIVTEKSNFQSGKLNQYVFVVDQDATKTQVKEAVETLFKVNVEGINIINVPAKRSRRARSRRVLIRRSSFKKAIVTIKSGQSINVFEGVQ